MTKIYLFVSNLNQIEHYNYNQKNNNYIKLSQNTRVVFKKY